MGKWWERKKRERRQREEARDPTTRYKLMKSGACWDLHRRRVGEMSARYVDRNRIKRAKVKPIHLLSSYLMSGARVNKRRQSLGFGLKLGGPVPECVVGKRISLDDYYEGGYLLDEKVNFELRVAKAGPPRLEYGFDRRTPNAVTTFVSAAPNDAGGWNENW
jgi:hypothetical protein